MVCRFPIRPPVGNRSCIGLLLLDKWREEVATHSSASCFLQCFDIKLELKLLAVVELTLVILLAAASQGLPLCFKLKYHVTGSCCFVATGVVASRVSFLSSVARHFTMASQVLASQWSVLRTFSSPRCCRCSAGARNGEQFTATTAGALVLVSVASGAGSSVANFMGTQVSSAACNFQQRRWQRMLATCRSSQQPGSSGAVSPLPRFSVCSGVTLVVSALVSRAVIAF